MEIKLLTSPASIKDMENFAAIAYLTCHANTEKPYVPHEVLGRIIRAGHESILEHITLTYSVKGLSRACLQELARHRHISLSVESTRHTLIKKLQDTDSIKQLLDDVAEILPAPMMLNLSDFLKHFDGISKVTFHGQPMCCDWGTFVLMVTKYFSHNAKTYDINNVHKGAEIGALTNDVLKYFLPEFWPTNLILTSNIRELRHILTLRTNPAALNEFRVLAYSLYEAVPEEYKYLLEDCVYRGERP